VRRLPGERPELVDRLGRARLELQRKLVLSRRTLRRAGWNREAGSKVLAAAPGFGDYQAKTSRSGVELYDSEEDHYTTRRLRRWILLSRNLEGICLFPPLLSNTQPALVGLRRKFDDPNFIEWSRVTTPPATVGKSPLRNEC